MNRTVKVRTAVISFALVLSVPLWAALQEKTAEKSAPAAAQAAKPGAAEMDRLKFYLGEWDYTETYPKSAYYPDGGKNTPACTPASSALAASRSSTRFTLRGLSAILKDC